jgi:hypothetical protein
MPSGGIDHAVEHVAGKALFDDARAMGTATLRGQIARFLRKRTGGEEAMGRSSVESEANSASPPPHTGITICCRLRSSISAHLGAYRSPPAFIHVDVTQA